MEGDCYFVGPAVTMQHQGKQLEARVVIYDAETGVAACVFYISGLWRYIVVDDRLPARYSTLFPDRCYPIYGSRP